jgi:chaperonin cofactor prefoldin
MADDDRVARLERAIVLVSNKVKEQHERIETLERTVSAYSAQHEDLVYRIEDVQTAMTKLIEAHGRTMDEALSEIVGMMNAMAAAVANGSSSGATSATTTSPLQRAS